MGLHQMPGDVWWRSWRDSCRRTQLPPPTPTSPGRGSGRCRGYWQTYTDPQSGKPFKVWEGHYTYPGSALTFIPTFGGGMFEGLMANVVVPETTWGPHSFGLADVRTAQVQIKYATEQLHYPVWGLSPSSTADDTGGYGAYGVEGLTFPLRGRRGRRHPNQGLSQCHGCATEDAVTPHASFLALDVTPQQAYANITALRTLYPGRLQRGRRFLRRRQPDDGRGRPPPPGARPVDDHGGAGQRAGQRAMQRHFAADPVSWAARTYLGLEKMITN